MLVRVQAPDLPQGSTFEGAPKRLALVVDRSGSMGGEPLAEALHCVAHIAQRLGPQDSVAVVTYDHTVQVLWPLQSATRNRDQLLARLNEVTSGGNTDLHSGWFQGAQQVDPYHDISEQRASALSRVILLSDGQANHGVVRVEQIAQQCADMLGRGVSTTTVGLGRNFNEELMISMARAGGGQQYYGQTAADLFDSFDEELALLQALYWRNLRIKLMPAAGVIVEPLGGLVQEPDGTLRMSDLAWGAEAWVAVRLHLGLASTGATRDLMAASLSATDSDGQPASAHGGVLQLPVLDAQALQALPEDETVARRLDEIAFAAESRTLRALAQSGDSRALREHIARMQERFGHHPWLAEKLRVQSELAERDRAMFGKEVLYSANRMALRQVPLKTKLSVIAAVVFVAMLGGLA
ncbi:MAG: VWA domain-containing protein, partial [Betaproteobacteria bacterium]|nr:VWA domain-containing protein [Betaproteobacteria bacterium]